MFGAAAMSLSSFCVVTNALRLNLFKIHDPSKDKKIKPAAPADSCCTDTCPVPDPESGSSCTGPESCPAPQAGILTKTLSIKGMMCEHCEAHVKKALEALPGVEEASASHTAGTAVVTLSAPVDDAVLKKAVKEQGYKVTAIH